MSQVYKYEINTLHKGDDDDDDDDDDSINNKHLYEFHYGLLYYGAWIVKCWTVRGSNPVMGRFSAPI